MFEGLVRELTPIERKELLEKIEPAVEVNAEPLISGKPDEEIDLEKEYYSLSLFERIIIFFKVAFSGENKFQLTEEIIIKSLDRDLRKKHDSVISLKKGRLLSGFYEELEKLHTAVKFFAGPVNSATRHNREEFLNFLGSLQIPIIHHQLILDSDFKKTEEKTGLKDPADVRKQVSINLEMNLQKITGELRKAMYQQSKVIHIMGELVSFDFFSLEGLFSKKNDDGELSCYFGEAREPLEKLANIISSFRISPDKLLLEALYLFSNENLDAKDEEKIQTELKGFISEAVKQLNIVRDFNTKIEINTIMKLITGNIYHRSKLLSGGEDWFNLYSKYWESVVDMKFKKYSAEKKKQKIYQDMQMYFKKDELPVLENYNFTYKYSCGFLSSFIREEFAGSSMNSLLKTILVDGRFYKKHNKEDFTAAYSSLLGLYEKIKSFDFKNTNKGEYGSKIDAISRELVSESERARRESTIIEQADLEAYQLVKTGLEALLNMRNVLYGILHGKAGGQYDSLANLNKLISSESKDFIIELNTVYTSIDDAYRILGEILSLEEAS